MRFFRCNSLIEWTGHINTPPTNTYTSNYIGLSFIFTKSQEVPTRDTYLVKTYHQECEKWNPAASFSNTQYTQNATSHPHITHTPTLQLFITHIHSPSIHQPLSHRLTKLWWNTICKATSNLPFTVSNHITPFPLYHFFPKHFLKEENKRKWKRENPVHSTLQICYRLGEVTWVASAGSFF